MRLSSLSKKYSAVQAITGQTLWRQLAAAPFAYLVAYSLVIVGALLNRCSSVFGCLCAIALNLCGQCLVMCHSHDSVVEQNMYTWWLRYRLTVIFCNVPAHVRKAVGHLCLEQYI